MKVKIPASKLLGRKALALASATAFLMTSALGLYAQTNSIGVSFVSNGSASGIDNAEADSLLPEELAGVPPFAQTNWNNLGRYGSLDPLVLTNSLGQTNVFTSQWDAGGSDSTGTAAGLGTPDGKLMNGFIYSWGPGAATTLGNSCYNSSINNKPIAFLKGLSAWYNSQGAEGYSVILYTTGYSYWETAEGWIQAASGSPIDNSMVGGADLTPHIFAQDTGTFFGNYVRATGTSAATQTSGANYMFFTGLTNDSILIRCQSGGYGAGLNGFQLVPVFPAPPTVQAPTFLPSDTVYAGQPVTLTEVASGDPFHPQLSYQWQNDRGQNGIATNNILNETNATYTITPTNNATAYTISFQVIVTNIFGASTSSVVTLNVNPAVAPVVNQDTTPGAGNGQSGVFAYVGGEVSFSASFGGTPATYLWQSNSIDMLGMTNATLRLANLQLTSSANYRLTATNSEGGIATTPTTLTVLADPAAPTSASPYAYDVFTNGPAAYWRFSETADTVANSIQAYDYSGHNLNATYGAGTTDNQPGPQSPSLPGFESTNVGVALINNVNGSSLIAPPLALRTNTVTITAWINPTTESAYNGILTWVNGSDKAGFGFGGTVSNGMAELGYVWNTNSPATYNFHSGLYPLANQWSFVALTITPTDSTLYLYYIDANTGITNLQKSVQTINNLSEPFTGGTTWIGSDSSAGRNFNGTLDELAVFNKSLSEVQLQDLFLKGIGGIGVVPTVTDTATYPANTVYSGQNVRLTASVNATAPFSMKWQSSPDNSVWTDIPGETSASLLVNPLTVGTVYYHLVGVNQVGSGTNNSASVTFNALPSTPAGLWTVNYQITNNILSFTSGNSGLGHYTGRGILGGGTYWNVLPNTAGAFSPQYNMTSVSDLRDDGTTHSGIYCTLLQVGGFSSASVSQPDSSDVGNLLNQMVQCWTPTNGLQFHGLPDGTYNLCLYGCDGTFADRGTTFVVHDSQNGDQTASTINASPIVPLQEGNNFVVFKNVHVSGGTLNVDVLPTPVVPKYNPNTEADFNGAQIQLVSLDASPSPVAISSTVTNSNLTLSWPQGILQTATNMAGPWTPMYVPSPATIPVSPTNSVQLYRIQVR